MNIHEKYITRCIELAKNGAIAAKPNPSVGCVIVNDDTILAEGYTSAYGGPHAEVNAINAIKDRTLLAKATLYVSLEPCNHFGKTPPCSDLIVASGIKKVVVGCVDPHSKVAGAGVEKLRSMGCEVLVGILEEACIASNKRFFTFHTKKRPYIILKWAQTKDGYIDKVRTESDAVQPNWITDKHARQLVHKWRAEEEAILVGTTTAINDNPKLDIRDWVGENPLRVVLDRSLRIPKSHHIYNDSAATLILTEKKVTPFEGVTFEVLDFTKNVAQQVCDLLYKRNIQSVFIEGGRQTLQTFIDANLWDEARIFVGNVTFEKGLEAPKISGEVISEHSVHSDVLRLLCNENT